MKNILTIESTVSLANEVKLMGISVYEDLHNFLVFFFTISNNKYSLALKKKKKKVDKWMVETDDTVGIEVLMHGTL
jgi:hypothetical protein